MMFREWLIENEQMSENQIVPEGYRGILYIMRGVPGSGKSNRALRLAGGDESKVFGADDFFMNQAGEYKFDPSKLFAAHNWNERRVREAMQRGITPVVVDNTNIKMRDAVPYMAMARQYQYWPEIAESDSPWWTEIAGLLRNKSLNQDQIGDWANKLATGFEYQGKTIKNVHGVPRENIEQYLRRYTPYTVDDLKSRIKGE